MPITFKHDKKMTIMTMHKARNNGKIGSRRKKSEEETLRTWWAEI